MPDPVSDEAVTREAIEAGAKALGPFADQGRDHSAAEACIRAALPFLRPSPREPSEEAKRAALRAIDPVTYEIGRVRAHQRACVERALRAAYAVDCPVAGSALADKHDECKCDYSGGACDACIEEAMDYVYSDGEQGFPDGK